jgi:GGDEF domain-containing protein
MGVDRERRLLLVADAGELATLRAVADGGLPGWEVVVADSFEQARFAQQLNPCDAVLLDGGLYRDAADRDGLSWLATPPAAPILLLADAPAAVVREALHGGADQWLERRQALAHPPLLHAVLGQVARLADLRRRLCTAHRPLGRCRRLVNRLVGLLWQTLPADGPVNWFTQRHMLERLHEEVARSQRHGQPLSLVLGEVRRAPAPAGRRRAPAGAVSSWTAAQVSRAKRCGDVAGQYGPHGFMLLLPHTTDAGAARCCQRLRPLLRPPSDAGLPPLRVVFGIATHVPGSAARTLLRQAEDRLDQARVEDPAQEE